MSSSTQQIYTDNDELTSSEYVPDSENWISEAESSDNKKMSLDKKNISKENYLHDFGKSDNTNSNFKTYDDENCIDEPDCEEPKSQHSITVVATNDSWNKKNYCSYCYKPFSKLPWHMESAHSEKKDIYSITKAHSSEEKKQRRNILYKLKNLGNHIHNI